MADKIPNLARLTHAKDQFRERVGNIVKADPWVPLILRGKEYKLEYSWGAVKDVYRKTGKNINAGEVTLRDLADPDFVCLMLRSGLLTHHSDEFGSKVLEEMEHYLTMRHMTYYTTTIQFALEAIQPDVDDLTRVLGEEGVTLNGKEEDSPLPFPLEARPF